MKSTDKYFSGILPEFFSKNISDAVGRRCSQCIILAGRTIIEDWKKCRKAKLNYIIMRFFFLPFLLLLYRPVIKVCFLCRKLFIPRRVNGCRTNITHEIVGFRLTAKVETNYKKGRDQQIDDYVC